MEWVAQTLGFTREELTFEPGDADGDTAYSAFSFLGPRIMDAKRMGMQMGGMMFPTPVGHTAISRQDLVKGALKGLAFAIRGNFEQLEDVSLEMKASLGGAGRRGDSGEGIRAVSGGRPGSGRFWWRGITDATLLGTAMCASVGFGAYNSLPEAVGAMRGEME